MQAVVFDLDGTLVDSVDLHALAWHEAMVKFGHQVSFQQARSQIGKGGDKLIPVFLSSDEVHDHGKELEDWRNKRFHTKYLPLLRPFTAVPDLLQKLRNTGRSIGIASSANRSDLNRYLEIAHITDLIDITASSEDVAESKPAPDIFGAALAKLGIEASETLSIGDTSYDAKAASRAGIATIGVLCGGSTEGQLREAGCISVYPGPATLYACFDIAFAARTD